MRSPRERPRSRDRRRAWAAAGAAAVVASLVLTAFSCATQETHDFSDGTCVGDGCQPVGAAVSVVSSSSTSGGACIDANCPVSWTTDIFNGMLDNPVVGNCTASGLCHGTDAGMGGVVLMPGDATGAYATLHAATLQTAPLVDGMPNAAGAKQYIVGCDTVETGMLCNMNLSSGGTNPYGSCGHGMPLSGMGLSTDQVTKIATWIQCDAPLN